MSKLFALVMLGLLGLCASAVLHAQTIPPNAKVLVLTQGTVPARLPNGDVSQLPIYSSVLGERFEIDTAAQAILLHGYDPGSAATAGKTLQPMPPAKVGFPPFSRLIVRISSHPVPAITPTEVLWLPVGTELAIERAVYFLPFNGGTQLINIYPIIRIFRDDFED